MSYYAVIVWSSPWPSRVVVRKMYDHESMGGIGWIVDSEHDSYMAAMAAARAKRVPNVAQMANEGYMTEWLVIEDSRKNAVFAPKEARTPKGYIPRDVAEQLLGRILEGTQWFTREESARMRASPEWRTSLDATGTDRSE